MNCKNFLLGLLAVMLVFSSCSKSSDLSNAIPADAKYVMYVDTKSLIDKSEYDLFKNQTVERAINMSKAFLKDQEQIKLIDNFLKDANSLGLNLKNDFYMYTNYKVYGVVLGVNDAKKIKEVMIKSSVMKEENITEENGIFILSPDSKACVAWNKDKMIFLIDLSGAYSYSDDNSTPVDLKGLIKEQLSQSADKSINSNKVYQDFSKEKTDFSVFYTMAGLDDITNLNGFNDELMGSMNIQKYFKDIEGVSAGMYGSFEKGEIKYSSKFFYDSPETEKKFKELSAQFTGNIKGDHLKYITEYPLLLATVNVKGEGMRSYMQDLGVFEMFSNEMDSVSASTLDKVVKGLNGDVTFAITKVDKVTLEQESFDEYGDSDVTPIPQCLLLADINNGDEILSLIKEQLEKGNSEYVKIKEINPSVYVLTENASVKIYFGVVNNMFFATNIESVYNNLNSTDLKNNYADKISGKSALIFGDVQILNQFLSANTDLSMSLRDLSVIMKVVAPLAKYEMTVSSADLTGEGRLELTDKDNNSLKTICKYIDDLINQSASSIF